MTDTRPRPDDSIDVQLLARQDLPHEAFPGGRNAGFRVFFSPEVHTALWKHASEDTSVEICGVLVGSWHRDEGGPFVKIIALIRGEGAETRFAEVTFTHQTWAKINAEMDSKYTSLSIVGWYHTHPDFGIFLSDRDRFIHEHFFCGPGQVAHVIDPIRNIEGVFVWRDAKPALTPHFWVGDRVSAGASGEADGHSGPTAESRPRSSSQAPGLRAGPAPDQGRGSGSTPQGGSLMPGPARLLIYGGVFLAGYLLANFFSAWEHQRFVENVLASNGFVAVLRLGLSDELDRLNGDLAALVRPLEGARSRGAPADDSLAEVRTRLTSAARRVSAIKAQYGNTPAEDEMLRRLLRDKLTAMATPSTPPPPASAGPQTKTVPEAGSSSASPTNH